MTQPAPSNDSLRIDKWLWHARKIKSRAKAARLVREGKIRINRQKISKPATTVRIGDVVTATISRRVFVLEILALGERRGPAAEAALLYRDISPLEENTLQSASAPAMPRRERGSGRPTKRERRQIERLKCM